MAIIPSRIDNDRKDFFKNCEYVTKAPASLFLEGDRYSQKAKILPIPLYAYVGIENGHSKFEYEEFNCDLEASKAKAKEVADILGLPRNELMIEREKELTAAFLLSKVTEEERRSMVTTPHSAFINYRTTYYVDFLDRHFKESLKYARLTKKVFDEANIKRKSSLNLEARKKIIDLHDKYTAEKFSEYFKVKVWSEIPFTGGLNEGSAIATATALALQLRFSPGEIQERMKELINLRENLWEEVAIDGWYMTIFTRALALDFFSNGAAVFASLLGCNREQEVINYECHILDALKDHFIPYPEFKKEEERNEYDKNKGIIPYFDKCIKFKYNCLKAEPLYNWNYEKLTYKERLAVAIISEPNIIHQRENFQMPPDLNVNCWRVSPYFHALIDDPSTVALCVANPERHIFHFERKSLSPRGNLGNSMFEVIYTSRRQGWGAEGVKIEELFPRTAEVKVEQMVRRPKEIVANFSKDDNYIKFDGKETEITGYRIYSLLEELINRKVLHWSWGLVVFDNWQKDVPDDPVKQFGMVVRRFNDEFGFMLIDYLPQEKKKSKKEKRTRWALVKHIIIKSTILESNNLCKETKKQKDSRKKLELLDKALSIYPNSLKAIKLFVHLLQNNPALIEEEKELIGEILPSAYAALVKRRDNLKVAIERIKEKTSGECPSYWKEAKPYSYEMGNELKEIEPTLNIIEKFLDNKKVAPGEDELNKISEDWRLLEKLASSGQGSDEEKYYKELLNQHFGRSIIKEILNKVSSKVQHRIADTGLRDDRKDITQEVFTYYLTLVRKGYFVKRNFKNIEELKGTLITGLSLKATDEIIKIKYHGNLTEANLRMIRDLLRAEQELTQQLYREPNNNEILKKLGPQWNIEKIEEIYDLKDELFKDERHIDIEKAQEFIEEVKRYEKDYREGMEHFFEP